MKEGDTVRIYCYGRTYKIQVGGITLAGIEGTYNPKPGLECPGLFRWESIENMTVLKKEGFIQRWMKRS